MHKACHRGVVEKLFLSMRYVIDIIWWGCGKLSPQECSGGETDGFAVKFLALLRNFWLLQALSGWSQADLWALEAEMKLFIRDHRSGRLVEAVIALEEGANVPWYLVPPFFTTRIGSRRTCRAGAAWLAIMAGGDLVPVVGTSELFWVFFLFTRRPSTCNSP